MPKLPVDLQGHKLYVSCESFDMTVDRIAWLAKKQFNLTVTKRMLPEPGGILDVDIATGGYQNLTPPGIAPFGMVLVGDLLYTCDLFDASIRVFDSQWNEVRVIRHRLFNDLHFICYDPARQRFLVVSSGVDCVIEFDQDFNEVKVWDLAKLVTGHSKLEGYPSTMDFSRRPSYPTAEQFVHTNYAEYTSTGIRCTLFHQGQIAEISKTGMVRVLTKGLKSPHDAIEWDNKFYVADSENYQVLVFDKNWRKTNSRKFFGWIQRVRIIHTASAVYLGVIDADAGKLHICTLELKTIRAISFPKRYRLADLLVA